MKFVIRSRHLPDDPSLLKEINSAAERLYEKLVNLDINSLESSEYIRHYFSKLLKNLTGTLQQYSYLMSICLAKNKKPLNDFIFVDYGGGSGVFSLLAKEMGIGTVIYNDIYNISCRDSKEIADSIGIAADEYICGEIREIIDFCKRSSIQCDVLGSYNVIEHIYNIQDFLYQLAFLSENGFITVLGTGANPYNPILRRMILKHHYQREFISRKREYGHKEGDSLRAYVNIRRDMINKYAANQLDSNEINLLVRLTRGLNERDILKCVRNYLDDSVLPELSDSKFPTNTCDPYTGNWAERLMDPHELSNILKTKGFTTQILAGIYGYDYRFILNFIGRFANKFMNLFPRQALLLAPYYILYGFKK
jgi:2-polyprenyl-3-methyl-5-hydroxy-6-metoxy-1,4-benzoquinol methylase